MSLISAVRSGNLEIVKIFLANPNIHANYKDV